ncbi:MAG: class I SAM-dependent methyltransferase [Candidatus Polarisedimenticolia bacterium]
MDDGSAALVAEIQQEIRTRGPMPFARFMGLALHHPRHGYYARPGATTGARGDFYTSPDLSPAFGRLIARQVIEIARLTTHGHGDPGHPFTVVEMGPGSGRMAADIIAAMAWEDPALAARTTLVLVESSPELRASQRERLQAQPAARHLAGFTWLDWQTLIDQRPGRAFHGCVVANEFLDALPVHVVQMRGGVLHEVHVDQGAEGFREVLLAPSTPRLARHLAGLGVILDEGQRAEINLEAVDWTGSLERLFGPEGRGGAILVDYGHEARELYASHRLHGTLMVYARHRARDGNTAALERIGLQDITAHVDLTSLARAGAAAGFDVAPPVTQMKFLISLGLANMMADLAAGPDATGAEATRERLALHALMAPGGMGEIYKVMLMTRGTPAAGLTGAHDPFRRDAGVPAERDAEDDAA